jgi:hypothetical protein
LATIEGYLLVGLSFAEVAASISIFEYQYRAVLVNFFDQISVFDSEYFYSDITIQSTTIQDSSGEFCPIDQTTYACPQGNTLVTFRVKVDHRSLEKMFAKKDANVDANRDASTVAAHIDEIIDYFRNTGDLDQHSLARYRNSVLVADEHCGSLPTQEVCYAKCALDMEANGWVQNHELNIDNELYTAGYFYQAWGKDGEWNQPVCGLDRVQYCDFCEFYCQSQTSHSFYLGQCVEVAEDPATCDGICPEGAMDHFVALTLLPGLHFCGSNEITYTLDKICLAHCEGAVQARYPSCDLTYEDYLVSTNMAPELIDRIVCTGGGTMPLAEWYYYGHGMVYHEGACTTEETTYLDSNCFFTNKDVECGVYTTPASPTLATTTIDQSDNCEYTNTECIYDGITYTTPPTEYTNDCMHLKTHNEYRFQHENTPEMSLTSVLCNNAQEYADSLAASGNFQHDVNRPNGQGENLYYAFSSQGFSDEQVREHVVNAVKEWYEEIEFMTWESEQAVSDVINGADVIGHFTQVVWSESLEIGLGVGLRDEQFGQAVYIVNR